MVKVVNKSYPKDHPIFSSGPQIFKPVSRPSRREAKPDDPIYTRGYAIGITRVQPKKIGA